MMEKLKKLRLDRTESIMTENEMKHVIGGARESSYCYYGQLLYTCRVIFDNRSYGGGYLEATPGSVCATSSQDAKNKVLANFRDKNIRGYELSCT